MKINHDLTGPAFAILVGLLAAYWAFQWVSDTDRAAQRIVEESVVEESRSILRSYLGDPGGLEISDPLDRKREAGKVYIYPNADGWEVSGQYRRASDSAWHPYLMLLDRDAKLLSLSVRDDDPSLAGKAAGDPLFSVEPLR